MIKNKFHDYTFIEKDNEYKFLDKCQKNLVYFEKQDEMYHQCREKIKKGTFEMCGWCYKKGKEYILYTVTNSSYFGIKEIILNSEYSDKIFEKLGKEIYLCDIEKIEYYFPEWTETLTNFCKEQNLK